MEETRTERQLRDILQSNPAIYDWVFTRDVRIDAQSVPRSHPVLVLNTRHLGDDHQLAAAFVHEQLHWGIRPIEQPLLCELEQRYPDLPIGPPDGCRTRFSNYLHLVICSLEYRSLITLLGPAAALATLQRATHYRRIYQTVTLTPTA